MGHIDSLLAVDPVAVEVEAEAAARKLEVDLPKLLLLLIQLWLLPGLLLRLRIIT